MGDNACPHCGRNYSRARDLRAHVAKKHETPEVEPDTAPPDIDIEPTLSVLEFDVAPVSSVAAGDTLSWRGVEHTVSGVLRDSGSMIVRLGGTHRLHFPHGGVKVQVRSAAAS